MTLDALQSSWYSHNKSVGRQFKMKEVNFFDSRCVKHMIGNCKESKSVGSFPESHQHHIWAMAKARSEDQYNRKIEPLQNVNPKAAKWFNDPKGEYAT